MKLLRKCFAISILIALPTAAWGQNAAQPAQGNPATAESNSRLYENRPVASIDFEPRTQPLEATVLQDLLPIKRGEPYHAADVRTAIARLFATGRYEDIQADATDGPVGVALRFITKQSWFVGGVSARVDFSEPPSAVQIVTVARLRLGEAFDMRRMPEAIGNIRKLLVSNGYFDPDIVPEYEYSNAHQEVNITFDIRTGKRAHYARPEISGDISVLTKDEIVKASRWRRLILPGYSGITESRTQAGIDRIRLRFAKANRVIATVVLAGIEQSEDDRTGTPRLTVDPGPEIEVRTPGAHIPIKQLREKVPIYEEHAIDPDLLAEGAAGLRDYFQSHGYFDATVSDPVQRREDGITVIDYAVDRGPQHRLVALRITGNKYFDDRTIRERMLIVPRSFEFPRGRFSESFRREDVDTIEALYQSNGFREVKVTTTVEDDYRGRTGDIAVAFRIEEGPQYTVGSLVLRGAEKLDLTAVRAKLSSQEGQPFSDFSVAADREAILAFYGQHGFASATFEWSYTAGVKPQTEDVVFAINEGPQQFVREVVISGLRSTRPSLVNKQITLNPGDPLSPAAMADTQRKLDDLGIFAQVDMAVQNPDGDEDRKFVLYDLEEAHKYSLTVAPGAEFARIGGSNAITDLSDPGGGTGVSPRITVNLTRLNFLGRAQTVSVQGILSNFQKRALANYYVPRIISSPRLDAAFSLLYDDTHDVRTFQSLRKEASAQIVHHISKSLTGFYRFSYRHVGASDLKIDPLLLPQLAQSVRVGIASVNLVQDRRDNPVDPHRGMYNTLEAGVAARAFSSQTSFVRVLARNATYSKIGPKLVFARETQFGVQPAFGMQPGTQASSDEIPLPERFFGGGGNSLRAVPENQAGPRDPLTGFPLGGSALFFNNAELRFPLYGSNVNGVLFEDMGNIFSNVGNLSFRVIQNGPTDFDYMVHAVGFGVRYRTPVGPLRLDLAYSINPPRFNGYPGTYPQLVACSIANNCQASPQQISHFQFFLSIGQAF